MFTPQQLKTINGSPTHPRARRPISTTQDDLTPPRMPWEKDDGANVYSYSDANTHGYAYSVDEGEGGGGEVGEDVIGKEGNEEGKAGEKGMAYEKGNDGDAAEGKPKQKRGGWFGKTFGRCCVRRAGKGKGGMEVAS
ncbi:hypothetical protein P280DRAFT_521644 [Massarina eburnea CBS 473.64]|uniref:Uncharacterized protein n=1 Tax=Massarina eburnea CBS 473.64 TaxID=1395130 RepID=A0A6A6RPK0_9PLEO|nr:hypothetical protein P280DRAFT_521644 [Massarina eburnea CBS 473.64]